MPSRRRFLSGISLTALTALAGCSSPNTNETPTLGPPDTTPTPAPTPEYDITRACTGGACEFAITLIDLQGARRLLFTTDTDDTTLAANGATATLSGTKLRVYTYKTGEETLLSIHTGD